MWLKALSCKEDNTAFPRKHFLNGSGSAPGGTVRHTPVAVQPAAACLMVIYSSLFNITGRFINAFSHFIYNRKNEHQIVVN